MWGCLLQSRLRPSNPTRSGNRCPQHSVIQEHHSPALTAARPRATPGGGRADLGRATPRRSALWQKGTDAGDRVSGPTGRTSVGSQAQGRPLRNCVSTAPRSRLGRHGAGLPPGAGARGRPLEGRRPPQSRPRCGLHGLMRLSQSPQPQVRSGHTADCGLRIPVLKALAMFGGRPCVRVRGNPPAFPPGDSVNALRSPWRTILTPPVGVHRGPDIPRVRLVRQTCSRGMQMVVERHSLQNCSWWQKK